MPLREQDRAVWVGSEEFRPVGSSGKVRGVLSDKRFVEVDWGGGEESVCKIGSQVVTCRQATNKGIEPWASCMSFTHGISGYTLGCRCEVCVDGSNAYHRAYRKRKGAPQAKERARAKVRKKSYYGKCEDCGAPHSGTSGGLERTPRWCRDCGNDHMREGNRAKARAHRDEIIRLFGEGLSYEVMARRLGLTKRALSAKITLMRNQGESLPYRYSYTEVGVAALRENGLRQAQRRAAA